MKPVFIVLGVLFLILGVTWNVCGYPLGLIVLVYGVLAHEKEGE